MKFQKLKIEHEQKKLLDQSNQYFEKNNIRKRDILELDKEIDSLRQEQINVGDDLELINNHIIATQQEFRRLEFELYKLEKAVE